MVTKNQAEIVTQSAHFKNVVIFTLISKNLFINPEKLSCAVFTPGTVTHLLVKDRKVMFAHLCGTMKKFKKITIENVMPSQADKKKAITFGQ